MSGGVDSSVAAALLVRAGHEVIGVFMRHGEAETACATGTATSSALANLGSSRPTVTNERLPIIDQRADHKQGCCSTSDAEDARRVADKLGLPFYALNLSDDFARIIDYFVDEYSAARTPNPCVMCNNWLKFGRLFEYADSVGAEFVATGHYARVEESGVRGQESGEAIRREDCAALLRGLDGDKDQSYVLFGVKREFLPRMLLPIGGYRKPEIRALAQELGLRVADKRDSQEICFVTSGHHSDFVRHRRELRGDMPDDYAGDIALADGTVVGRHAGIEAYTIGQRKGLGVALGEPYFVTRIEAESKRVVLGKREELARRSLTANRANWLADLPDGPFECVVQIRYNSDAHLATVELLNDGRFAVEFAEPCYGVSPGQAAVCYAGDRVLGGGWIE